MNLLAVNPLLSVFVSICLLRENYAAETTGQNNDESFVNEKFSTEKENIGDLVEWIELNEGYIDDRQSIHFIDGKFGIYAHEDILKGESLLFIPPVLMINSEDAEDRTKHDHDLCHTIDVVNREMEKGYDSGYWPFMDYLRLKMSRIPGFWTKEGIDLFQLLIGNNLPPRQIREDVQFEGLSFYENICNMKDKATFEASNTAKYVYYKHLFGAMVPFYDLYNHRNGKWLNTKISFAETGFYIEAERNIQLGEQIYISHNMCNICQHEMDNFVGTPNLFLRHGFVEPLPQRWELGEKLKFDLLQTNEGELELNWYSNEKRPTYNDVSFLLDEIERLQNFPRTIQSFLKMRGEVDKIELGIIREYHVALETVIQKAIESSEPLSLSSDDVKIYDMDEQYWRDNMVTCKDEYLNYTSFLVEEDENFEVHYSQYQRMSFFENLDTRNKCLELDGRLQICSSYRSHYHEPFVHFPAVFIPSVRRVVFIGGGDSMLLHEVLKYKDIELIVGLELDQKVVRQSFKHFFSSPHFDDDRVEWWFGDATKTLNILPKEYFGSFDLVLVDLAETVMSFTITQDLNMLNALALLAKPDGIFVKNEHYIHDLKKIFDYTIELYVSNNPMICDQHFAIGSNRIDFLEPHFEKMKENKIHTLLYKPLDDINSHYGIISEYSSNNIRRDGECESRKGTNDDSFVGPNVGVFMAIDAENVIMNNAEPSEIGEVLTKTIEGEDLTILSIHSHILDTKRSIYVLVMKEGYIVAHSWVEHSFFAFDIQLWAAFYKLHQIKLSLLGNMNANNWQTYRIVVGGIGGTESWEFDRKTIGPRNVNMDDCDHNKMPVHEQLLRQNQSLVLEKSLSILDLNSAVVVLCGRQSETSCQSLDTMSNNSHFTEVIVLLPCQDNRKDSASNSNEAARIFHLFICRDDMERKFQYIVSKIGKVQNVVVDQFASESSIKRLMEVLRRRQLRTSLFHSSLKFIVPMFQQSNEFRKSILPKIRLSLFKESSTLTEISVGDTMNFFEIGFLGTGSTNFFAAMDGITKWITEQTGIESKISKMKGNVIKFQNQFDAMKNSIDDYDYIPAINQYIDQHPLASQNIFQLRIDNSKAVENIQTLTLDDLQNALEASIPSSLSIIETSVHHKIGDGAIILYILIEGHIVCIWDGIASVDLNILTYDEDINHKEIIVEPFRRLVPQLNLILHDEQPRGMKRVVNFKKDIKKGCQGCVDLFFNCKSLARDGLCKENDSKKMMERSCPLSCGWCDN